MRHLSGEGIEIGALHRPLWVPNAAHVRYVDAMARDDLLAELAGTIDDPRSVVATDVVDDGERLERFADESLDFVIANHMLEHTEDPIGTLTNWSRVLRPGGVLFITLPDARHTFDAARPRTTVEHLLRDHREGPGVSREHHHREWARLVERLPEEHVRERVAQFEREQPRIHFHVWELEGFLEVLHALELPLRLEAAQAIAPEFTVVLRKDVSWRR